MKQATRSLITRSIYELLLFEVVMISVNEIEMKRLKDLDAGVGQGITGKLFF